MNKKLITYLFIGLILVNTALATGIAPSRKIIQYEPNKVVQGTIRVVNNEQKSFSFTVYPTGDLAEHIGVQGQGQTYKISEDEFEKTIHYTLTLPEGLSPGEARGDIVVVELDTNTEQSDSSIVKSLLTIKSQIIVSVPYPGKYIKSNLAITNTEIDKDTLFTLSVFNLGDLSIEDLNAVINIKTSLNELITSLDTNTISLGPGGASKITSTWFENKNPGKYIAEIIILFDGEYYRIEKEFEIGSASFLIKELMTSEFRLGGIAKLDVLTRNMWSEEVSDVYAKLTIMKSGEVLEEIKSASENVLAYDDITFSAYWDTTNQNTGEYQVLVEVLNEKKLGEEIFDIYVGLDDIRILSSTGLATQKTEGSTLVNTLLIVVILLVVINISWLIIYLRREKKK